MFIKNEAKKRAIDLTGDAPKPIATAPPKADTPPVVAPALPVEAEATPTVDGDAEITATPGVAEEPAATGAAPDQEVYNSISQTANAPANRYQADTELLPSNEEQELSGNKATDAEQEDEEDDDDDVVITTERPEHEEQPYDNQVNGEGDNPSQDMQMDQQPDFNNNNNNSSFSQGMNGFNNNFGNMNMNGFNPMMGMPNFMGMPNMMGRYDCLKNQIRKLSKAVGMNMDPSMMFGGNFGGMGDMSAMMGMGMGNMGGGMSGMGDFNGMNGPGFFPNQGNYMQSQNFGNGPRSNDFYNNRGYGRGYGRGFGRGARGNQFGRGRGGWGYQQQQQQQYGNYNQSAQHQPVVQQQSVANTNDVPSQRRGSPSYDAVPGPDGVPAESGKSHDHETNGDQDATAGTNQAGEDTNPIGDNKDMTKENGDAQWTHGKCRYSQHSVCSGLKKVRCYARQRGAE